MTNLYLKVPSAKVLAILSVPQCVKLMVIRFTNVSLGHSDSSNILWKNSRYMMYMHTSIWDHRHVYLPIKVIKFIIAIFQPAILNGGVLKQTTHYRYLYECMRYVRRSLELEYGKTSLNLIRALCVCYSLLAMQKDLKILGYWLLVVTTRACSPDLNLTPLPAFLRFCRAQRGLAALGKKRKKAARGVRFKSGLPELDDLVGRTSKFWWHDVHWNVVRILLALWEYEYNPPFMTLTKRL